MENDKSSKVTEFPSVPAVPAQMAVPPELLVFAAIFGPAPAEPGKPRQLNFLLGASLADKTMTPSAIYQILGELRTQIRKWVAANGNATLADGL